jgi:hypothetical protein
MLVHPLSSSPATTAPHIRGPCVLWAPVFILLQPFSVHVITEFPKGAVTSRRQVHPILYEADAKQVPVGLLANGERQLAVVP